MPNVNQETGVRHPSEPDKTLRTFRAIDEGAGKNLGCLGMQLVPTTKDGALRVGDEITVLEVGEHHYQKLFPELNNWLLGEHSCIVLSVYQESTGVMDI